MKSLQTLITATKGKRLNFAIAVGVIAAATLCGQPVKAEILIGHTAALTGPSSASTLDKMYGAQLYFDWVNANGGVKGRKIKVVSLDDEYDPKKSAKNAELLVEKHNVMALFMTGGTPQSLAVVPVAEKNKMALVAPSTGAIALHEPVNPYVYNVRTSYQAEAIKLVHNISLGIRRIGVVYQADTFGDDGKQGALIGLREVGIHPTFVMPLDRKNPDFAPILAASNKADVQFLVWIGSSKAVSDGISYLRNNKSNVQVATLSNVASNAFISELGQNYRGVVVAQVYPSDKRVDVPYLNQAKTMAAGKPLSGTMLEGFTAAKVMVEALNRAAPELTRARVVSALANMNFDLGGAKINYHDKSHTGLNFTEVSMIGEGKRFIR